MEHVTLQLPQTFLEKTWIIHTDTQRFQIQILKDLSRRLFYTFNPWNSIKTRITSVSQLMSMQATRCRDVSKECKIKELMQNLILRVWKEKEADAERRQRGYIAVTPRKTWGLWATCSQHFKAKDTGWLLGNCCSSFISLK